MTTKQTKMYELHITVLNNNKKTGMEPCSLITEQPTVSQIGNVNILMPNLFLKKKESVHEHIVPSKTFYLLTNKLHIYGLLNSSLIKKGRETCS